MGGVVCGQTTEYDFSNGLPTGWTITGNSKVIKASYGSPKKSCTQLQANGTIESSALGNIYNHIKLNITRSGKGTDFTITYKAGENSGTIATIKSSSITSSTWKDVEYDLPEAAQSKECIIIIKSTKSSYYINSITLTGPVTDTQTKTTLSFGEEYDDQTIIKYIGDENIYSIPATLTPTIEDAKITYSSSNPDLVYIDENNGDIMVAGKTEGSAIIKAEYAGDDTHTPSSASYTVQVKKHAIKEDGVFDFTSGELNYGSGLKPRDNSSYNNKYDSNTSWTNGVISISTTGNTRWFLNQDETIDFRLYNKAEMTISVPSTYIINKIQIEGDEVSKMDKNTGEYASGIWTGNSNSITFTSSGTNKINTITVTYYNALTTAASSFATYAADDDVDYSAVGLAAYAIDLNEAEGKVVYKEISGTVKAETPVLVKGEASTSYAMIPSTADAKTVTTALQISDGTIVTEGKLYYGFATINGVSGFKLVNDGITIPTKKGYLKLSAPMSNAKTFYAFDGDATGIEETFTENEAAKAYAPMYNISGQRVGEGYKGIVIVNGKKYMK